MHYLAHTSAYYFNDRQIVLLIMRFPAGTTNSRYLAHTHTYIYTHTETCTYATKTRVYSVVTDKVDSTVNDDRCRRHFHDTKYEK